MPSHTKIDIVHGSVIRVLVLPACGLFAHKLWRVDVVNDMIKCAQEKISDRALLGDWLCPRNITPQSFAGTVPVQTFFEFLGLWYFSHIADFKCCPKP